MTEVSFVFKLNMDIIESQEVKTVQINIDESAYSFTKCLVHMSKCWKYVQFYKCTQKLGCCLLPTTFQELENINLKVEKSSLSKLTFF